MPGLHRSQSRSRSTTPLAVAASLALALSACVGTDSAEDGQTAASAADPSPTTGGEGTSETSQETADDHDEDDQGGDGYVSTAGTEDDARETVEAEGPSPRLGVTYDGGVMVIDAMTLDVVGDFPAEGFTRLNPAGDDRHLLLTEGSAFRVLDTGVWSEPHGDHDHSYATVPELTDLQFEADHPGHVVTHAGQTVLFDDGTGEITVFDPETLVEGTLPEVEQSSTPEAHHGLAVELADGSMLHTVGDEESADGAVILTEDGTEIARNEQCPGVHGETVAADEAVVMGCEGGVLVYLDGEFTKIDAEQDYARIGNVAGSGESPVVLGDYKTDAEAERPTTVSLVDTRDEEIRPVELPASYSFRSLGRDSGGDALVLGTDGMLRTVDADSGDITHETAVVAAWEEPMDWQEPRPTLQVMGDLAYVTEPVTQELHVVDLRTDEVIDSTELPSVPNEVAGVTG